MSTSTSGGSTILTEVGTPAAVQGGTDPLAAMPPGGNGSAAGAQTTADKAWWADYEAEFGADSGFAKIKGYESPKALTKAYMSLEKLQSSSDKVTRPRADDDADGWDAWYRATGRPDKAEEYEFKRPDSLPDGFYSEDIEKEFRSWVHENGLSKKQAANLHDRYVNTRLKAHHEWSKAQGEQRSQAELSLKREFGDKYEAAQTRTKAAYQKYADPEFAKYLDETGLGNDPRMIRVFNKIATETMGETRLKGAASTYENPADLDRQIADYRNKYNEALFKKDHPDHNIRVAGMRELFEKRHG